MRPEVGVGAIVAEGNRLLLVERAHPPEQGTWALPGGHLAFGEELAAGVVREVYEETGLTVDVGALLFVAEVVGPRHHFVILDYGARVSGGEAHARSDARRLAWADPDAVETLPLTTGMAGLLADGRVREYLGWE